MATVIEIIPDSSTLPIIGNTSIFLAGTIDMGNSVDWQADIVERLTRDVENINIYNPRRGGFTTFDTVTQQYQINWELDKLHWPELDLVFMYFAPDSMSPVTLLELGLCATRPTRVILVCNESYQKYHNVQITADRYNIPVYLTLNEGYTILLNHLNKMVN